jgi:hypothetical protein
MSTLLNPKLASIDDALTELETCLTEFGRAQGFTLVRSHEGSFNVPRRWLYRELVGSPPIRHEIGLVIALPMPERMGRGFFPDIPCTLYVAAYEREAHLHCYEVVVEAQPFSSLKGSLPQHLRDAVAKLETLTPEFISQHGNRDPLA